MLRHADGSAWMVESEGSAVEMTREWLHYEAAVGVIRHFGHMDAAGKGVTPADDMVYLGVTIDVVSQLLSLSQQKCDAYLQAAAAIAAGRRVSGGVVAPAAELSSLIHKLLHASSVIPLGRQHLCSTRCGLRAPRRASPAAPSC